MKEEKIGIRLAKLFVEAVFSRKPRKRFRRENLWQKLPEIEGLLRAVGMEESAVEKYMLDFVRTNSDESDDFFREIDMRTFRGLMRCVNGGLKRSMHLAIFKRMWKEGRGGVNE